MRQAKSYSIVDHQLLHGGYMKSLSHEALSLYLFLVIVGDRDGRSYYSQPSIVKILRFTDFELNKAIMDLQNYGLIQYRTPYFFVENLSESKRKPPQIQHKITQEPVSNESVESLRSPKDLINEFFLKLDQRDK